MGDINLEIKLKNVSESVEGLKELIEALKPLTASGDIEIVDNVIKIKSDLENVKRLINPEFITLTVGDLIVSLNSDDNEIKISKGDSTYIDIDDNNAITLSTTYDTYSSNVFIENESLRMNRRNKVGSSWLLAGELSIEDDGTVNIMSNNRINLDCTADGVYINNVKIGG